MARLKLGDPIGELVRVLALLLLMGGAIAFWIRLEARDREFRPDRPLSGSDLRFQTDNAVGATANAVEWLARQTSAPLISDAIWFGLALLAVGSLRKTRIAMQRLADELAPVKESESRPGWSWSSLFQRPGTPPLVIDEEELRPDVPLKKTKSAADRAGLKAEKTKAGF